MPQPAKECFSPAIYAELLSIHPSCETEIRELITSNLKAVPDDPTTLHLQPIVWACLLQHLSPFNPDNLDVMQILFTMIPPSYWSADFIPPTQFIECSGIKILYGDTTVATLRTAIQESLYPYVAESVLQRFVRILSPLKPAYAFLSQDPRLHLLLSMADSPSMRSMPISTLPFYDSLFIRIIQGIGDFLGVKRLLPYDDDIPTVPLDSNRHAVLKMLYTLILSTKFDDTLTLRERNFVLTIFLRVLNSTSLRPPFLAKDWCTPQLATKFMQDALEDTSWLDQDFDAYELGTYFFRSASFTNETVAYFYFVSILFEHLRTQDSSFTLLIFWNLFVSGLASEDFDLHIRQQSLEDLYEPENLFTCCAILIYLGDSWTLRRLAFLRPKDPAWSSCLQRLQDFEFPRWTSDRPYAIPNVVADFKAFIEGECVDSFGEGATASSSPAGPVQGENDNSPQHPTSTVWHRVRRFIAGEPQASREEIELSSSRLVFV